MSQTPLLIYAHDPMCSWCYGFKPVIDSLTKKLKRSHQVKYLLGGLAADSNVIMPLPMQDQIKSNWQRIENSIQGTKFNYNFWNECNPKRSTYPACRAVIAAKKQHAEHEMINAIQQAYYLSARNPSENHVLSDLAKQINLNTSTFKSDMNSKEVENALTQQITLCREMGADSFPSLFLFKDKQYHHIVIDYNNADTIIEHIKSFE